MFDLTSRRSSFQGRNSGKDELTQKKFYKNLVVGESNSSDNDPNASFKKLKKIFPKHHSDQNITKSVEENKGSEPRKKSQFLSEETKEAISTSKKKSLVERKSNMTKKVIHEDVENEDKASISLNSQEETKLLRDKRNARVASFSPMVGAEISREDLNLDKLKMTKREHSMNHVLSKKATELRTMWKRSTTEYMKDEDQSSSLYKSRIDQIVTEVDMERKLNSRTPKRMQERKSLFGGPENQIIDYRRQGVNQNGPSVHKQRRLSRINLGKQLELSETLGLRLQWRVD